MSYKNEQGKDNRRASRVLSPINTLNAQDQMMVMRITAKNAAFPPVLQENKGKKGDINTQEAAKPNSLAARAVSPSSISSSPSSSKQQYAAPSKLTPGNYLLLFIVLFYSSNFSVIFAPIIPTAGFFSDYIFKI